MKRNWIGIVLQGCLVFLLAACNRASPASPPDESLAVPASPTTVAGPQLEPGMMTQPTLPSTPDLLIEKAQGDLAQRLAIPISQINLVEAKPVVWPDASLGCPQPGVAYAQVTTPGYWILLEAAGIQYPYHSNRDTQLVLCQEESSPLFPVKPGEINDGQPWMPN